jgi:hypothetical protein
MKKCPPGVFCIENVTLFLVVIGIFMIGMLFYSNVTKQQVIVNEKITVENREKNAYGGGVWSWSNSWPNSWPSWPYSNDVLLNPYSPPYGDERYFIQRGGAVPINVSTNIGSVDTTYRQIGILTPVQGTSKDNILPCMGRPLFTSRDKWQYYAISNQHNNVKLPILYKKRNALNDNGVDQLYEGDIVHVQGYNEAFRLTKYENDTIKYLPFF